MPLVDEKMHRMGCPARNEQPWLPRCSALRISMFWTSLNICWIPGKPEETSKQDDQHLFGHSRVQGTNILLFSLQKFDEVGRCRVVASRFIKRSSTTTVRWLLRYKGHMVILYMCSLSIVVLRHAKPLPDAQFIRRKIHLWSFDKEDMKKILLIHFEVLWTCPCLSFGPSLLSLPSPAVSPCFAYFPCLHGLHHPAPCCASQMLRPVEALPCKPASSLQWAKSGRQRGLSGETQWFIFVQGVQGAWDLAVFCNVMYLLALKIKRRVRKGERRFCWGCLAASSNI